jgi:general secretion pathway protein M
MTTFSLKSAVAIIRSFSLPLNLQRRDKIALAIAGAALALFIVLQLIIFPILDRGERLRNQILAKQKTLQEVKLLQAEYRSLTRNARDSESQLNKRAKGFRLFSFLDGLAGQSNIKPNIIYMKPTTSNLKNSPYSLSMVEMKINGLTMEQLLNFLHGVENSPNLVWIKRISISRGDKEEDLLNATLQVETYQL